MDNLESFIAQLKQKSPSQRLKDIRKKLVKKNQLEFCGDGIVREGTLKSVESNKLKISPKIAERLVHKLGLEGIVCSTDVFLEEDSSCVIQFDEDKKRIISNSSDYLEEIKNKTLSLMPIEVKSSLCPALFPNGGTVLARKVDKLEVKSLKNTLCFVQGAKQFIAFLNYERKKIKASLNGNSEIYPLHILDLCDLYVIELIYYNNQGSKYGKSTNL